MKLVGFIKEYNDIKEAVSLDGLVIDETNRYALIEKVIAYLNSGELLLAWMGYFFDVKTKKPIAPDSYYTDGVWVWPIYFPYYLNMFPSIQIDPDFLSHLESRNFELKLDEHFKDQRDILEEQFARAIT